MLILMKRKFYTKFPIKSMLKDSKNFDPILGTFYPQLTPYHKNLNLHSFLRRMNTNLYFWREKTSFSFFFSRAGANIIRFYMYRNSTEIILVIMFIAGTARADVLSLVYVAFALYFLWNSDYLLDNKNSVWKWARLYNYLLVMFQVFIYYFLLFFLIFLIFFIF